MTLNPEFRRQLWIELTKGRLIATPILFGLGLSVVWYVKPHELPYLAKVAEISYAIMVYFWGTRRAAASFAEEISSRTWDDQRMSALSAWQMTWGKLLGATAFSWYAGLFALAVSLVAKAQFTPLDQVLQEGILLIASGFFGQATALLACLVILRSRESVERMSVTFSQALGLVAAIWASNYTERPFEWAGSGQAATAFYEWTLPADDFRLITLLFLIFWAFVGVYRHIRRELQYRMTPIVWVLFAIFLMTLIDGLFYGACRACGELVGLRLSGALGVAIALVYAGLFVDHKNIVSYRGFVDAARVGRWGRASNLTPLWLPPAAMTFVLAVGVMVVLPGELDGFAGAQAIVQYLKLPLTSMAGVVAVLLFLLRDIALVLTIAFGAQKQRYTEVASLIILTILYFFLPGLLEVANLGRWIVLFRPISTPDAAFMLASAGLQAMIGLFFLVAKWRGQGHRFQPST